MFDCEYLYQCRNPECIKMKRNNKRKEERIMAERTRKKAETQEKKTMNINMDDVKIKRAYEFDNGNVSFDMEYAGMTFYRMTVVKTKDGKEFVSFPSYESNGKWFNYYYMPLSEKDQDALIDLVYEVVNED